MHLQRTDLPVTFDAGPTTIRATAWGDLLASVAKLPAGTDLTPLFHGLPDDRCPCPHWGYMLAGALRVVYTNGTEETIRTGALFYLPPGHTVIVEEDVEFVEFSPARQLGEVMEVMAGNMEAAP